MPRSDRFSPYQFSMWMDNESSLQEMKQKIAEKIFPNEEEAGYKFFDKIITPILEKMEEKHYARKSKKINKEDPLFILKYIVKNKTYEGAKQALYRNHLNAWWYKGGRINDENAENAFQRLYLHSMGETMYDDRYVKDLPYLSDLRQPSPTGSETENIFIQQFAGWKTEKFPDMVRVFRGTNSPHNEIKPGDFVTFDRDYAESYMRGKFGAIVKSVLPSKDLKVYKMDPDTSELIYWPHGHVIKKFTGKIPTFKEFWETWH